MGDVENDDLRLGFQPLRRVGGAAESCWKTGFDASADESEASWEAALSNLLFRQRKKTTNKNGIFTKGKN